MKGPIGHRCGPECDDFRTRTTLRRNAALAESVRAYARAQTYAPANEIEDAIERTFVEPIPDSPFDDELDTMPVHVECRDAGALVVVTRRPVNRHVVRRAR